MRAVCEFRESAKDSRARPERSRSGICISDSFNSQPEHATQNSGTIPFRYLPALPPSSKFQAMEVHAMPDPVSLPQIDLTPLPGKQYFSSPREWREEFIYFLMVDRFHDDQ